MKSSAYRKRVEQQLDDWISAGLVESQNRSAILATLPEANTTTGRVWLAMAATVLAGLSVIALIADNWEAMARGLKLLLLSGLFISAGLGAAVTYARHQMISNGLSLLAALIFSASIALVGQAYNLPGEPTGALLMSGFAAALIGLAGRSSASSFAALIFVGLWIVNGLDGENFGWMVPGFWGIHLIVGLAAFNMYRLQSAVIWHGVLLSSMALSLFHLLELSSLLTGHGPGFMEPLGGASDDYRVLGLIALGLFSALWCALCVGAIVRTEQVSWGARTLAGYGCWAALLGVALLGLPMSPEGDVLHRFIWLGASFFLLWLGAKSQLGWVSAGAIVSLFAAISVIFIDLGMELALAGGILGLTSVATLVVVVVLKMSDRGKEA